MKHGLFVSVCGGCLFFSVSNLFWWHKRHPTVEGFAVLMMITDSVHHEKVWDTWVQDALQESEDLGGYMTKIKFNFYIHMDVNKNGTSELRENLPSSLKSSVMNDDVMVDCQWGKTVPCMNALLKESMKDTSNQFFIFVSGSTVPVKPFAHMAKDLLKNRRSRMCFSPKEIPYKKHSQWVILNREAAKIVLDDFMPWTNFKDGISNWKVDAQNFPYQYFPDDEYVAFRVLELRHGRHRALEMVNNGNATDGRETAAGCHTAVFWDDTPIGKPVDLKIPLNFHKIFPGAFKEQMSSEDIWFVRKFVSNVTVEGEGKEFQDFVIDFFRSA